MRCRAIFIYDVTGILMELIPSIRSLLERDRTPYQISSNEIHALAVYWFKYALYEMHHISFDGFGDIWRQEIPAELRRELIRPVHIAESMVYRSIRVPLEFQTYIPRLMLKDNDLFLFYD